MAEANGMKILVTGGLGYIGSHAVVELIEANFQPIIIDNLSNTDVKNLAGINSICGLNYDFHQIDCTDYDAMKTIF